jgi:cobalt/nickel transport system permease protein
MRSWLSALLIFTAIFFVPHGWLASIGLGTVMYFWARSRQVAAGTVFPRLLGLGFWYSTLLGALYLWHVLAGTLTEAVSDDLARRWFRGGWSLVLVVCASRAFSQTEWLDLFRLLRIPGVLLSVLAIMMRYLGILRHESVRLQRAQRARTFAADLSFTWAWRAEILAALFARSVARAERVYKAMIARGWSD